MTSRQARRAAERKARKEARKATTPQSPDVGTAPVLPQGQNAESSIPARVDCAHLASGAPSQADPCNVPLSFEPETDNEQPKTASPSRARLEANRANAQLSTGPASAEGKAVSSQNNFRHGFRGNFGLTAGEDAAEFNHLASELMQEHRPQTITEQLMVQGLAEHHWLVLRARRLQQSTMAQGTSTPEAVREMSLWMRYEAQHERAFHKCLSELRKLREERRNDENGFERQKQAEAAETRNQEAHVARQRLTKAKADALEFDTEMKAILQAPFPGYQIFDLNDLKTAIQQGLSQFGRQKVAAAA